MHCDLKVLPDNSNGFGTNLAGTMQSSATDKATPSMQDRHRAWLRLS